MRGGYLVSKFKSFQTDVKGSLAITVGVMAIPLMLGAGVAIDIARATQMKSQLQAALDSAVLSAATNVSASPIERKKIATEMLEKNLSGSTIDAKKLQIQVNDNGDNLQVSVVSKMSTTLMALAGIDELNLSANVEAKVAQNKNAEISLVLDYSGSMGDPVGGQTKYVSMRNAAIKLIDDMVKVDPKKVKFALVPFSHHVRVTLPATMVRGASGETWTGCTQDRPYPANVSDVAATDNYTKWGQDFAAEHVEEGCDGYTKNQLRLRPLTNDFQVLKKQLESMTPYAWTHIALGVEFGLHTLLPSAPFEAKPLDQDDNKKFMVVLTDGAQTEPAFGPNGVRDVEQGEKNLAQLCSYAKEQGITIITIAYDLDDKPTRNRLRACASGSENAFVADDTSELSNAFNTIKTLVLSEVYLSQ